MFLTSVNAVCALAMPLQATDIRQNALFNNRFIVIIFIVFDYA